MAAPKLFLDENHGYTRRHHENGEAPTGCSCPEDLEHGGPCQNRRRSTRHSKCVPCSEGWHYPFPCNQFVQKPWPMSLTVHRYTYCDTCGWDDSEHADVQERWRKMTRDL